MMNPTIRDGCIWRIIPLVTIFTAASSLAQEPAVSWSATIKATGFVENKSQFDGRNKLPGSKILYALDNGSVQIYFTKQGLTYRFENRIKNPGRKKGDRTKPKLLIESDIVHAIWEGANPDVFLMGIDETDDHHTYAMLSDDRTTCYDIRNIKGYRKLLYRNLYPGIDVEYVVHPESGIKYSLVLRPGADLSKVKLKYQQDRNVTMDEWGKIHVATRFGDIIEHAPVTFYNDNNQALIPSRFILEGTAISFKLNDYNRFKMVVIDPWVQTPALPNSNGVWECEKDGAGNVYIIGGDSPMKLLKYNAAGVLQWTYNTPYDTLNNWLGTLATDLAGNSYVTSGSIAAMQKVNTTGGLVWNYNSPLFSVDEYWSIAFNCDQTKLVVGGTTAGGSFLAGAIFDINTTNGNVLNNQIVAYGNAFGIPIDIQEVRAITSSRNAKYYFLTLDTIGAINQNFSACSSVPLFKIDNTYNFGYKCENYRPANGNSGICAIRANAQFVYTQNGTVIHKRSPVTGAIITTAAIPGGITVTDPFFGTNQAGNSGIDLDDCGNVYVGSGDRVIKYDANLNIISSVTLPFRVYDVAVSYNGEVIVCGATGNNSIPNRTGYVRVINMAACAPFALTCCDATVCPAGPFCTTDAPVTLLPVQPGGTWSGRGITNPATGTFSPAVAGPGVHKIAYTLSCGSDTVAITVSFCAQLSVCVEPNGQYTVSGGTAPYTWEQQMITQDCSACLPFPFPPCAFPPGCAQNVLTWTTFAAGTTVTPPGTFPIRVNDSGVNSLVINSAAQLPNCSVCPPITVTITSRSNVTCAGAGNGRASVSASGGAAPYVFTWQPGSLAGASQNNLSPGTYSITATDMNRCTGTTTLTITEPTALTLSTSQTNAGCAGNDGTASVTASGGTPPYTYLWNNGAATPVVTGLSAGNYTVTVGDVNNCFATASFSITETGSSSSTRNVSICDGESFFAGGANQTSGGTYYDTMVAANGCDSIVITGLTVLPNPSATVTVSICEGESYFAGGANQTESGIYYDTLIATNGCDSILITNLIVEATVTTTIDAAICEGDAYFAGGTFQTEPGTYYDTLTAAGGCDSVVITTLTVNAVYTVNQDVTICEGESYFAGGGNQTTSGIYYDSLVTETGCDSIIITSLTVLPLSLTIQNVSICDGESYFAGGDFQTASGNYYDTLIAANGCDSVVITYLLKLSNSTTIIYSNTCSNDTSLLNLPGSDCAACPVVLKSSCSAIRTIGGFLFFSGTSQTYRNFPDCRVGCINRTISNVRIEVTFYDFEGFPINADVFLRGHYMGGINVPDANLNNNLPYPPNFVSLFNRDGGWYSTWSFSTGFFDGTDPANLDWFIYSVNHGSDTDYWASYKIYIDYKTCEGIPPATIVISDTLIGFNGCDSVLLSETTYIPIVVDSIHISICEGESYFAGGANQTESGIYYDTLIAANGCDSILITNLIVEATVTTTIDAAICEGDAYFAGGTFQTEAGTYYDTLTAAGGCDSVVITTLTVNPVYTVNHDVTICRGESYFAGGGNQTTSGIYYDSLVTETGCDSIIITSLTVLGTADITVTNDTAICRGSSVQLDASGGLFTYTWIPAAGLNDPYIANPVATPLQTTTYIVTTQVPSDDVIANGDFSQGVSGLSSGYMLSTNLFPEGTYYIGSNPSLYHSNFAACGDHTTGSGNMMIVNGAGIAGVNVWCQTVNVVPNTDYAFSCWVTSVVASSPAMLQFSINGTVLGTPFTAPSGVCPWQQFYAIWNSGSSTTADICIVNQNTTLSGNDFALDDISFTSLCPASDTVTIIVLNPASAVIDASICEGQSYFAGSAFQTEAGTYYDTLTAANGCDSIVTTNLSVLPHASFTRSISICEGESFHAGGEEQTASGIYYDTLTAANGCDSVVTTNLSVLPHASFTRSISICEGESFHAGGEEQTASGTYYDTLTAANGCDSIVTTNLSVLPHASFTRNISICEGESFHAGGEEQTASGIYYDTLTAANECDSVVTTVLAVLPNPVTNLDVSICNGESYFVGGAFQTQKGTYYDTLTAANGCDSIVVTNLDVLPNPFTTQDLSICEGESFFAGGGNQTAAGTYYDTLTAANGCDSIIATTLSVLPLSFSSREVSICEGESFFAGGASQTTAGIYYDTLTAANGCDSIITTSLTVNPNFTTTIDTTICDGSGYFAGGALQTASGTYYDTLSTAQGCDSIIITSLSVSTTMSFSFAISDASCNGRCDGAAECTVTGGQDPLSFIWSNGGNAALNDNLCADTYGLTVTDANGCTAASSATVGEPEVLMAATSARSISCDCANAAPTQSLCVIDFAGLPAGTILDEQYAQYGIHIFGDVHNSSTLDKLIIFNSNATGTQDPDLQAGIGNLAILPQNLTDHNGDGLVDAPNDNNMGGRQIYLFDTPRDVISFIFVDKESPGTATAYDASGSVIKSVTIPSGGNGSVQTVILNAQGVSRLVIDYRFDSGGVTRIQLGCAIQCCDGEATAIPSGGTAPYSFGWSNGSDQQTITSLCPGEYDLLVTDDHGCQFSTSVSILEFDELELTIAHQGVSANCITAHQLCELNFADLPPGTLLSGQYAPFGIHISGDAYGAYPDQLIIFDADASGTPDPDLETATGHLAIFPERLSDNNGDGLADVPNDQSAGGRITFSFAQDREVISFIFVDKESNNPATAKAYDADNNLIKSVSIPNRGNGSVQTVTVNAAGVRRLVIDYRDSGGVTALRLGCSAPCCDGTASATVTGGTPPYSFEWSNGATSASIDSLCSGSYAVTVTDAHGCSASQSFSIADCSLQITAMALVRPGVSSDIAALTDGSVIMLDTLCPFNIRAIVCQSPVGSVKFKINGVPFRIEEQAPYALAGDNPAGNYHPWTPQPGSYTVEAIPYSGSHATGTAGSPLTLHLTLTGRCGALRTSVDEISSTKFSIQAYPNPFNDALTVAFYSEELSSGWIVLRDLLGRKVMVKQIAVQPGANKYELKIDRWIVKAAYLVEVLKSEGTERAVKVVVKE